MLYSTRGSLFGQRGLVPDTAFACGTVRRWVPAADVREEDGGFVLYIDVPGVDPKDIDVTADAGVLTVSGERTKVGQDNGYRRSERISGRFERRFSLPEGTDADAIEARGRHGVLEVIVPKRPDVQPKRIEVTH